MSFAAPGPFFLGALLKLKTRVTSLDEIPEAYRDRYTAAEDGKSFSLDEIELEDTAGLKANHERVLKAHSRRKKN